MKGLLQIHDPLTHDEETNKQRHMEQVNARRLAAGSQFKIRLQCSQSQQRNQQPGFIGCATERGEQMVSEINIPANEKRRTFVRSVAIVVRK